MFNAKKGRIMRHPYATLAVIGLAAAGVVSIGEKVRNFATCKAKCLSNMVCKIKKDSQFMN